MPSSFSSDPEPKVLIIGAGPAGAFLAQILRGKGIAFEIFERETDLHERKGGGFALDTYEPIKHPVPADQHQLTNAVYSALSTMTELLPYDMPDWWTTSVNYPHYDNTVQIDATKTEVTGYQLGLHPNDEPGIRPTSMVVCRQNFRSWMLQNLPVQTNKHFSHYTETPSGVTAHFKDGSSAQGSILVGADGAASAVRTQLLGSNTKRDLHTFVPICGSFSMKGEALQRLRALASAGIVTANPDAQAMIAPLELMDAASNKNEARYWWVVAYRSTDPARDTDWVHTASKQELFHTVMDKIVPDMPDFTRDTLRLAGPSSVWHPQIRFSEYIAPPTLPTGRVTLMGDAAHNTTPYGGMGANTRLNDAGDLGRLLASSSSSGYEWTSKAGAEELLQKYNAVMLPRGRKVVLSSRAVGNDASFGMDAGNGDGNGDIMPWHESITTLEEGIPVQEYLRGNPTAAAS